MKTLDIRKLVLAAGATLLLLGCGKTTTTTTNPTVNGAGYDLNSNPFDKSTEQYRGYKAAFHGGTCDSDSAEFNEGCERFYEDKKE